MDELLSLSAHVNNNVTVCLPATVQTGDLILLCTRRSVEMSINPTLIRTMREENAILQGQVIGYDLGPILSELVDFNVQITIIYLHTLSRHFYN